MNNETGTIWSFSGEYRWLSNFWPAVIVRAGITYPTVEHAYQAEKTLDMAERRKIAELPKAGQAKRAGRNVIMRSDWDEVKIVMMEELLCLKFEHPDLRKKLLATEDAELIEANNWNDRFWGVCLGSGRNELGKALMRVRSELQGKAVTPHGEGPTDV